MNLVVRPLEERDLDEADRIARIAFGTYLKVPNPIEVFGDAELVRNRYRADPSAAFCAELDGAVVGSVLATRWGSFAFFGPLTVHVDLWDRGIGACLLDCHCGAGSEAGSGGCYVKFGAVRPGEGARARFERLVGACEALAVDRGLERLMAGVNIARRDAYRALLDRGYRAVLNGVATLRGDDPGYNRPDAYVIDDLR
jgi:hypothetical protein